MQGDAALSELELYILSGQVSPGQKIHVGKGCKLFSMSIEAFREECSALDNSGLLSRYGPDEWSIRWLSNQEAADRFGVLDNLSILISQALAISFPPLPSTWTYVIVQLRPMDFLQINFDFTKQC